MTGAVRVRRCAHLFLRPVERTSVDFAALLCGESGLRTSTRWIAMAPHLVRETELTQAQLLLLSRTGERAFTTLDASGDHEAAQALLDAGVLLAEHADMDDAGVRETLWHPLDAVQHAYSRWSGIDADTVRREAGPDALEEMVERCGPPPPHFHRREDAQRRITLDTPRRSDLDELLARRVTCRNFDLERALSPATLSTMLKRVFGTHGSEELAPGAVALKKNHPSGGGLHPIEAYLIVQRVEGLACGLYHYNVQAHALDLLHECDPADAHALALTAVAGQAYFADAPVLTVLAARFARSQWKYRNHPKIYRAIVLEAGHISQNLYLSATEQNLGAFITAAINEVEIEQAFGLDPMAEGPLAVCGFGARATKRETVEFDPRHSVWPAGSG